MLQRQDVGHRVVIRRRAGTRDGRQLYSDVLGDLVALTDTHATVVTTAGPLAVPLAEIHRAKRIPPPRRASAADTIAVARAVAEAWPAPIQERLGDWVLRAGGPTSHTRSALPIGDPGCALEAAIDAVTRWYAARGERPRVTVPLPLAAPVDAALAARGWLIERRMVVQTAALSAIPTPARLDVPSVTLTAESSRCVARVDTPTGDPMGVARATLAGGGRWLGLTDLEVAPAARRRGIADQLVGALADWARRAGARDAVICFEDDDAATAEFCRRVGFRVHHRGRVRVAPHDSSADVRSP